MYWKLWSIIPPKLFVQIVQFMYDLPRVTYQQSAYIFPEVIILSVLVKVVSGLVPESCLYMYMYLYYDPCSHDIIPVFFQGCFSIVASYML